MYHLQIITRETGDHADVQAAVLAAIREGRMVSFEIDRVRGGVRLRHRKFKGDVRFLKTEGPLMITVRSPDPAGEWQLLDAFIGRIVYHFADSIRGINIPLDGMPAGPKKPARRVARRAARRATPRRAARRKPKRARARVARRPKRRTRTARRTPRPSARRTTRRTTRRAARRGVRRVTRRPSRRQTRRRPASRRPR
ncbi:MAG TPA: hypothetical protein VLE53_00515 [Gemmatimonadaceae bacterium]|nr:hypothetical protein [Gemmatimonadaceae bacterium]